VRKDSVANTLEMRVAELFTGPGEVRALARDLDWSATPLGAPATWSPALRAAVLWIFDTPVPVCLWAGPDYALVYNDAYRRILSAKHPASLGQPGSVVWAEIWEELKPQFDQVRGGGAPLYFEDAPFVMARLEGGGTENAWFSYSLSALRDEDGAVSAILNISPETTARVLADAALKRSEAAARMDAQRVQLALAAGAIIGTWLWDLPTDRVSVDAAFAQAFGLDPALGQEGIPLEQIIATVHPDDRDGLVAAINKAVASGGAYAHQYRVRRQDGQYHWIEANGRVEHGADGTPLRFPGVLLDISGRKAADDARNASEARLRLVVDGAKDHAIVTTNNDGAVTGWSSGAEAIFGWSSDEMVGRPITAIFTPEDLAAGVDVRELQTAAASGSANDERWHLRKDGRRVFMSGSVHPLPDGPDGMKQGFLKIARDETDRRAAAQALADLNAKLEQRVQERTKALQDSQDFSRLALSAVNGVGVWTYDALTNRFTCDAAISRLYGLDPKAGAAGLSSEDFLANVHPDDKAHLAATMAGGLQRPGDLELEYRLVHADGSVHWVLSRGHTYFDDGKPVRRTGVGIETTDKRLLEEQLRQSQKMEAVGQLTGGIAHDFNNLLAGISGSLELLGRRLDEGRLEGVSRYIGAAQESARRAAALTQRLLAFARRQTLDPKVVDINRVIAGMADLLNRSVGPAIHMEVVQAAGLWSTRLDPSQLENAILNLCINSRDAMAPNGGRITIETANKWLDERAAKAREIPAGQYVSVCVTDTGAGMPPEVIDKVFDPFFTTKPLGQGTGLGLSMIYGFVRQSGGQVRIYSEVGKGTTMCLYLPRHYGEADSDDEPEAYAVDPGAGETVLIIDDEAPIRMLVADVLTEHGYTVLEAVDGPAGLRVLQADNRIDLLITDVGLPGGLNGRQVADAARTKRPELKVLFITGFAENSIIGNGHLDSGMSVITKPFPMDALALKVRELFDE